MPAADDDGPADPPLGARASEGEERQLKDLSHTPAGPFHAADSDQDAKGKKRRFTPVHILLRVMWSLVTAISLTLLMIVAVLWKPPEFVLNWLVTYVERLVLDQTGLPVKIGRISLLEIRPLSQRLELENVYLYGFKKATVPFVLSPRVSLDTDLISYLLKQPQVTLLKLQSPQLRVYRDSKGQINFRPQFPPSKPQEKPSPPLDLPRAKLAVEDLVLILRNEANDYKVSSRIHVHRANADLHDNNIADVYGALRSDFFVFRAKSQVQVYKGLGWATGKLASLDIDHLNPYTRVKDLQLQKGRFFGNLWANWDDYSMKNLRYNGELDLDHVLAEVPFFNRPVTTTGKALVNEKRIELVRLLVETDSSVLRAHGWLYDFLKDPTLDLNLNSSRLEIGPILRNIKVKELAPVLKMNPQGILQADVRVRGPLRTPQQLRYSGRVALPVYTMQDLALRSARANFEFVNNRVKSQVELALAKWQDVHVHNADADIDYRLANGHLQSIVHVAAAGWKDAMIYGTRASVDYLGKANKLKGDVFVDRGAWQDITMAHARGDVVYADNRAQGKLWLEQGAWKNADLANGQVSFRYQPNRVDAQIDVGSGSYSKAEIQSVHAGVVYTPAALYVHDFRAQAFSGSMAGNALIGLGRSQAISAKLAARQLSIGQIESAFDIKIPADYRPDGRFNLDATAGGTLSDPRADASFYSAQLLFPSSKVLNPLKDLQGKLHFSKPLTTLAVSTHSLDTGTIKAAAMLSNLDGLQAKLEARELPLKSVNRWSPDNYLGSGSASLVASMHGSLKAMARNWMNFDGAADFTSRDITVNLPDGGTPETAQVATAAGVQTPTGPAASASPAPASGPIQQHLDQADLRLTWNHGLADVEKLVLANDDSRLEGHGQLSVPRLMSPKDRDHAFTGELKGDVDVADFPILAKYDLQGGHVHLALTADTLKQGDIVASLRSNGEHIRYRGVDLDSFRLSSDYADRLLRINQANLTQGKDSLDAEGTIDFKTQSPTMDLAAHTDDFDLKTLIGLLPPDIRRQIEPGAQPLEVPKSDNLPDRYELPAINQRQIFRPNLDAVLDSLSPEDLSISWNDLTEHWRRYKLEPTNRTYTPPKPQQRLFDTIQGELSLDTRIKGTFANPDLDVQALLENLKVQNAGIAETYLDARLANQVLRFDKFYLLEDHGGLLNLNGEVDLRRDANLEVSGKGLRFDAIKPFLSPDLRLDGTLNFDAAVTGPTRNPKVQAEANVDRLLLNRYFFDGLNALANYTDGYLRDSRVDLNTGAQQVSASGDVPVLDLTKPIDLSLKLDDESFGLMNLFTNAVDWRSGSGSLLVRIVGSPKHPLLEGTVTLDDAEIYIAALKETLSDFTLRGELARETNALGVVSQNIVLAKAEGTFGGGKVQTSGTMFLNQQMIPEDMSLTNHLDKVTINYTQPGLFNTTTLIDTADIILKGSVTRPAITGSVTIGPNGEIYFPFLKDKQNIPAINSVDPASTSKPAVFFGGIQGGFKVLLPTSYHLNSPLFDIQVVSPRGIEMWTKVNQISMKGDVFSNKGKIYVLNNILNVDKLDVELGKGLDYNRPIYPSQAGLKADFSLDTSFNIQGANEPVNANISGNLESVRDNDMKFTFSNTQGLTDSEIIAQLIGFKAVEDIAAGGVTSVAAQFSESLLRGLFDPLTSRISSLLGLEELSFGISGQSARGPVFKFTVRSNPFFFIDEFIEKNLSQLEFLNRIRLRATGYIDEQTSYDVDAAYRFNEFWALDYQYQQLEAEQSLKVNGSFQLDGVLRWSDCVRRNYFGWGTPDPDGPCVPKPEPSPSPEAAPSPAPSAQPSPSDSASPAPTPSGAPAPSSAPAPTAQPSAPPAPAPMPSASQTSPQPAAPVQQSAVNSPLEQSSAHGEADAKGGADAKPFITLAMW